MDAATIAPESGRAGDRAGLATIGEDAIMSEWTRTDERTGCTVTGSRDDAGAITITLTVPADCDDIQSARGIGLAMAALDQLQVTAQKALYGPESNESDERGQ